MKSTNFNLMRYDADEGKVFDWKEVRRHMDKDGIITYEHLYAKTLFIGANDSIDNYKEVEAPNKEV